jgi:WD40 repeat protein
VSPDGRFVVEIRTARRLLLTDLQRDATTDLSDQNITAVAFAPEEPWFAAAGSDGRVTVWDSLTGKLQRTLDTRSHALRSIAVAPDGRSLAVGGVDGVVAMYEMATGRETHALPRSTTAVNCVRYSPNGRWLAVATGNWMSAGRGHATVYDAESGATEAQLSCDSAPGAVAFASDEELIVGQFEGQARLWNLATRQVVAESQADKAVIATAMFSPDNPALREITFAPVPAIRAENETTAFGLFQNLLNPQPPRGPR